MDLHPYDTIRHDTTRHNSHLHMSKPHVRNFKSNLLIKCNVHNKKTHKKLLELN